MTSNMSLATIQLLETAVDHEYGHCYIAFCEAADNRNWAECDKQQQRCWHLSEMLRAIESGHCTREQLDEAFELLVKYQATHSR